MKIRKMQIYREIKPENTKFVAAYIGLIGKEYLRLMNNAKDCWVNTRPTVGWSVECIQVSMPRIILSLGKFSLSHSCVKDYCCSSTITHLDKAKQIQFTSGKKETSKGPSVLQFTSERLLPPPGWYIAYAALGPQHVMLCSNHPSNHVLHLDCGSACVYK